jgi:hypothetical protein
VSVVLRLWDWLRLGVCLAIVVGLELVLFATTFVALVVVVTGFCLIGFLAWALAHPIQLIRYPRQSLREHFLDQLSAAKQRVDDVVSAGY